MLVRQADRHYPTSLIHSKGIMASGKNKIVSHAPPAWWILTGTFSFLFFLFQQLRIDLAGTELRPFVNPFLKYNVSE